MNPAIIIGYVLQYGPAGIDLVERLYNLAKVWENKPELTKEYFDNLRAIVNEFKPFFDNPPPNPYVAK